MISSEQKLVFTQLARVIQAGIDKASQPVIVSHGHIFSVPKRLAVCPYCNSTLSAQALVWSEGEDGLETIEEIELECDGEPDIASEEWKDWISTHFELPYVYWLPILNKVEEFIKVRYRVKPEESASCEHAAI
jgi:hypothetical protein